MNDLIDRQAAIEALKPCAGVGNRALDKLRALPTADAVEVVRCKACAHWSAENTGNVGYCDVWDQYINNGEFFCACGCRR